MKTQDRIEAVVIWLMEEEEEVEGKLASGYIEVINFLLLSEHIDLTQWALRIGLESRVQPRMTCRRRRRRPVTPMGDQMRKKLASCLWLHSSFSLLMLGFC